MLAAALVLTACPSQADPFGVDHILQREAFGSVRLAPDGRKILFERQGPYESADRFDLGFFGGWTTSEVWVADKTASTPPRPLLAAAESRGVVIGDFSPSGRRLVVHRLQYDRWETGVVELATGVVAWLGLGAEPPVKGQTVIWRSDQELLLTARSDGDLPYEIGGIARAVRETDRRRQVTALGGVGITVWGAGRLADKEGYGALLRTWRIDLANAERTLLAEGQTLDMALSEDGRWLAVLDRGAPAPATEPLRSLEPPERRRLRLQDLSTGEWWQACGACEVASGLLGWSKDGKLLIWERDATLASTSGRFLVLDPARKAVALLSLGDLEPDVGATRDASFQTVRAVWTGADVVALARRPGASRADWYRVGEGEPINLTASLPGAPGGIEAVQDDGFIVGAEGAFWSVSRGGSRRLSGPEGVSAVATTTLWTSPRLRLNTPEQKVWVLGRAPDGSVWRFDRDHPAEVIAATVASDVRAAGADLLVSRRVEHDGEVLELQTLEGRRSLARINGFLADVDFGEPLLVTTRSAEAAYRTSWLIAPPGGLRPGTPVILLAYPGASTQRPDSRSDFSAMANAQLLAGFGYAVLLPALPGTGPDGPAAHLTERILATLDAALEQYPELDGNRVGYIGHSFGGYAGLVLATETDRIRSFVVLSSSANLAAAWGAFAGFARANPEFGLYVRRGAGWSERGQGAMGGPPWNRSETYIRNSPFFRAGSITAPVLLVHGDLDFVPLTEAESVFTALWRQNKDVQLVTYWGEHHLFSSPGVIRDLWSRVEAWFASTIGPPPARLTPSMSSALPIGVPTPP